MNIRESLSFVKETLSEANIRYALVGGIGLACHGSTRATIDIDFLVDEKNKEIVKKLFKENGFSLDHETEEVLQFSGPALVDFLIARRPTSKKMLDSLIQDGPEGISYLRAEDLIGLKIQAYKNDPKREHQDKADIQFLIFNVDDLDWKLIREYADMFDEWETINEIKNKT